MDEQVLSTEEAHRDQTATEEKVSEIPTEQKTERYSWDPKATVEITGEQFGLLNMAVKKIILGNKKFSIMDFQTGDEEFLISIEAEKVCQQIIENMKKNGIAKPMPDTPGNLS